VSFLLSAYGQTNSWISTNGGKWETSGNWNQGAPSLNQSACVITNANTKTVLLDSTTAGIPSTLTVSNLTISGVGSATNTLSIAMNNPSTALQFLDGLAIKAGGAIYITNSMLIVDITTAGKSNVLDGSLMIEAGGTLLATNSTTYIGSAIGASGQLTVSSGGEAVFPTLTLGYTNNSAGNVIVTGGTLLATNVLFIGPTGTGQMMVTGGTASNRVVDIGGRSGLNTNGTGTLTVSGGTFYSQLGTFIGYNGASTGAVWVTGGTNTFGSTTAIAVNGSGQMTISNGVVTMYYPTLCYSSTVGTFTVAGGNTTAYQLQVGGNIYGTGVVWMTGGNLTLTSFSNSTVFVGYGGDGFMTISNGTLTTLNLDAGYTSLGVLNIAGNGIISIWSNMTVGIAGSGNVWMNGGQLLVPSGSITAGYYAGTGQITVSNGTVVAHDIIVGGATAFSVQGSLTMAGGSLTALADMILGDCSTSSVGTVTLNAGTMFVTNAAHNAFIDVRNGRFIVNGGTLVADGLVMTNACGQFVHNGGTLLITTTNLSPNLSAVGDGIPNGWKQQYGLDPFDPNLANEDPDGDGFSNLQEYLAGTNPTNSASGLRIIGVAAQGGDVLITWRAGGGRTNVVQRSGGLPGGYFNISSNIVISGMGDVVTNYLDKGAATNATTRFYRIALVTSVVSDTTAPTLAITSPSDNSYTTNATITVAGTSADVSGVAAVTVNGVAASSTNGYTNWTATVSGLTVGTNTLVALAADNAAPANIATSTVRVVYAAGLFDGNGDGLPDVWQIRYFGCVTCPAAAPGNDADGSGFSNLQEYLAGTDPTNPAAAFRITSVLTTGSDLLITWTMGPGKTNALQSTSGVDGGYATNGFADLFIVTNTVGTVTNYLDVGAATNAPTRYYRVRLVP
jgi:hypothetical protein